MVLAGVLSVLLTFTLTSAPAEPGSVRFDDAFAPVEIDIPERRVGTTLSGVVRRSGEPVEGAWVQLFCSCLGEFVELRTDADGRYSISQLPPGVYTIRVQVDAVRFAKIVELPADSDYRGNFGIDPDQRSGLVFDTRDGTWMLEKALPPSLPGCDRHCRALRRFDRRMARKWDREDRRERRRARRSSRP